MWWCLLRNFLTPCSLSVSGLWMCALGMCMTDGNVSGRVPEWEISQLRTVVVCPCSMCVFLGQCVFSAKSLMCECSTISGKVYIFSRLPCGSASVCKQHEWLFYAFTLLYTYMWLCYSLHMWCVWSLHLCPYSIVVVAKTCSHKGVSSFMYLLSCC